MNAESEKLLKEIVATIKEIGAQRDDALGKLAAAVKLCEAKDKYIAKLEAYWGWRSRS